MVSILNDAGGKRDGEKKDGRMVISLAKWAHSDNRQSVWANLHKGQLGGMVDMLDQIQQGGIMVGGEHKQVVFWQTHDYKAWCDMFGSGLSTLGNHRDMFDLDMDKRQRGGFNL